MILLWLQTLQNQLSRRCDRCRLMHAPANSRRTNGPEEVGLDITIDYLGSYRFGGGTEPVASAV
jgi:hypothetical protein